MTIGINGYEAVVPRFGFGKNGLPDRVGSAEIAFEIIKQLFILDKKNDYKIYLPVSETADMPKKRGNWNYIIIKNQKFWTATKLSKKLFLDRGKLDVFFSPTHYLPLFTGVPSVISILDLSYIHFPNLFEKKDLYQLKFWGGYSVRKASKIVTISQASKNDIISFYGVKDSKVEVVYPGIKEMNTKVKVNIKTKYGLDKDFILFVGTLQPRKNISRLIEAFSLIKDKYIDLAIIGKKGWMFGEILAAPQKFGVPDRVKFLENVADEDLPSFYQRATCFVLPSLYEGFGLPILEAMQNGCPVITSKVSSLPEAGGDAAIYVNPLDTLDIVAKIDKVLSDEKLRESMIEKGYEQVKKFSWEKAAKKTLAVLKSVAAR